MNLSCRVDHLVLACADLAAGAAHVRALLGVELQPGGRHPLMGTHNALLRLGPRSYLEVIAVDPGLPGPARPRWFELDRLGPADTPRLATWVARTDDIAGAVAACPEPLGEILPMTRDDLAWRIAVPPDGHLHAGGVLPALIQWDTGRHPAARLEDRGCSLAGLTGRIPAHALDPVRSALGSLGLLGALELVPALPSAAAPQLVARIATPAGEITLG